MARFNLLEYGDFAFPDLIQFHWGFEDTITYKIGDKIAWLDHRRPKEADGRINVPGLRMIKNGGNDDREWEFYSIEIENDIVLGVHECTEDEYNALESDINVLLTKN